MSSQINISIVIPVYNSEKILPELVNRIAETLKSNNTTFEFILVDDASTDKSWTTIENLKQIYAEKLTGIRLGRNYGQHNATLCGMRSAVGEFILTIDDDLQHMPEEIIHLINCQKKEQADLVYGVFKKRSISLLKQLFRLPVYYIAKWTSGIEPKGSSFRLIKNSLAVKMSSHESNEIFIEELARWYTNAISFTEVSHEKSKKAKSGYSILKLFSLSWDLTLYSSDIPLRILAAIGYLFALVAGLIGLIFIIKKLVFAHTLPGFTSLIVAISFSSGLIIYTLAFIALYLGKIYRNQNSKPQSAIRTKI